MPEILGKVYSDRIARMQDDLERASGKPVLYELLQGTPQELLCRGEYAWEHTRGSVVRLIAQSSEYDCAHELAHGLMVADGYPMAMGSIRDPNLAVREALSILGNTILHLPLHLAYLPRYGYAGEAQQHYIDAARELVSNPTKLRDNDNPDNYYCTFHATALVEIYFAKQDEWDELRKTVRKAAPNTWSLARNLIAARKRRLGDSPFHIRAALVEMIRVLDKFLRQFISRKRTMFKWGIVGAVLRHRQADLEVQKVFKIDFYKSDKCFRLAYVKVIGDGSYCHLWECQDQNHVDWIKRNLVNSTAREFLALLDPAGFKVRLLDVPE